MNFQFKDVEHLLRLAAIFAFGTLLFLVVRAALVPDDFGEFGHYRGGSVEVARSLPVVHAGQAACGECHADVKATRSAAGHSSVACESCHGPLARHAEAPDAHIPPRPDARALCVRCHAANTGKPRWYRTVDVRAHAGEESCVSCHTPHDPRMQ
jgi:hypothetical protein